MNVNDIACIAIPEDVELLLMCVGMVVVAYSLMFVLSFMEAAHKRIRVVQKEMDTLSPKRDCEDTTEDRFV